MKTSVIDIDHIDTNEEVVAYFENENLQKGDTLKLVTKEGYNRFALTAIVVVIIIAFVLVELRRKREEDGGAMLDDLFKGKSLEDIEAQVRSEYGINLEVETGVDTEREEWMQLAGAALVNGYGDDEVEYTDADIKEPNPDYIPWKEK